MRSTTADQIIFDLLPLFADDRLFFNVGSVHPGLDDADSL
jgi:hypothetical protein